MRPSSRAPDEMRVITIEPGFTKHAEGSCLISFGDTRVLVTASVEDRVPPFMSGKGEGWVTAEYGMTRARPTRAATAKPPRASNRAERRKFSGLSGVPCARSWT